MVTGPFDEPVSMMEPLRFREGSGHRAALADLALELARSSAGFRRSLPEPLTAPLAGLVRSMNCYYSNLIEGHETHPVDIERALSGDYSGNPERRNLQLEARAHIAVQAWIDEGDLRQRPERVEFLREIHRRFCAALPEDLLWVPGTDEIARTRIDPGEFRRSEVAVARHIPIRAASVARFMARFEEAYAGLGPAETLLNAAGAHHRLLWIHPFLDGNGRVARLMSHAVMARTVESGGLWSVARGLAHKVDAYKGHLSDCDLPRRNDLDGRGPLSEECLAAFTRFFLETCLDQVRFMESLLQPAGLRTRVLLWAEEEVRLSRLPAQSPVLLQALLYRGELPRADVATAIGLGERHARRITSALTDAGILLTDGPRSPYRLAFPARLASRWMPGLFPDRI